MSELLKIHKKAIFIADVHFNNINRKTVLFHLKKIQKDETISQIFLVGDIFDLLIGDVTLLINKNRELINKLNELSIKKEIIYLEGNRDFYLKKLFPNITLISNSEQPLYTKYNGKTILISHGDIYPESSFLFHFRTKRKYKLLKNFTWIIEFFYKFYANKNKKYKRKSINFNDFALSRIDKYKRKHSNFNIIIEGHLHSGKSIDYEGVRFYNIPAYCEENRYVLIEEILNESTT